MDPAQIFEASLKRCLEHPDFMLDFYGFFMDSSPEIRQKFANTDFKQQTRVVAESFRAISVAARGPKSSLAWSDMPRLAELHSRSDLDIPPAMYDTWLDCLIEAVRKHDGAFSADVEEAWRTTLGRAIEYMRSKY